MRELRVIDALCGAGAPVTRERPGGFRTRALIAGDLGRRVTEPRKGPATRVAMSGHVAAHAFALLAATCPRSSCTCSASIRASSASSTAYSASTTAEYARSIASAA